jgi:hypothetical protein
VNILLYQRRITNRLEAVDLAGLDDKDIAGAPSKVLPLHWRDAG